MGQTGIDSRLTQHLRQSLLVVAHSAPNYVDADPVTKAQLVFLVCWQSIPFGGKSNEHRLACSIVQSASA
jgi:hypothetical protein